MALTRVTSSVLDSNAVSAEKIANSALTNRMYGVKSIGLEHLANDANLLVSIGNFNANTNLVENNVRQTSANAAAERANVLTITSNIVQNVANINLNTGTGVRLSQNLAANVNQTTANVTAVEARRVANIAGAVSTITTGNLTASRALVSDGSGKVAILASVTSTELGYVDATSSIQTQLNTGVTKINQTTTNVNQTSTNVAAILAGTTGFTGQVTMADDLVIQGNLTVLGDSVTANTINSVIQDRFLMLANSATGAPSADVGIFMNRGNEGNAAIFYDESTKSFTMAETRDPDANVVISPTGLANLVVGTLKYNGADLNTAITDNRSGAVSTVYKDNLTASRALASDGSGKIVISDVTSTELGYLDGVTSAIQTQLNAGVSNAAAVVTEAVGIEARRAANIAGAVSTITTGNLTASRALVSDGSGKVAALASVTSTELAFLDATSSIQTQLDSKGSTAGFEANDFVTFTRLNANINVVSANIAVGLIRKVNVIASTDGEGAGNNNFFIATPPAGNPAVIDNIAVTIDGVTQAKTTDYLYTAGTGKITFKDAAIPTGLTVTITSLNPPT
jgi:hypothetical protein